MSDNNDVANKNRKTPGPKPDKLKIKGNWERAVKKSLKKGKPKRGWPR